MFQIDMAVPKKKWIKTSNQRGQDYQEKLLQKITSSDELIKFLFPVKNILETHQRLVVL